MLWRTLLVGTGLVVLASGCGESFQGTGGGGTGASGGGATTATTGEGGSGATAGSAGHGGSGGETTTAHGGSGGAGGGADPIAIVQATPTLISLMTDDVPLHTLQPPPTAGNAVIVGITCFSEVDNCIIPPGGVTDDDGNTYQLVMEGDSIISSDTHGSRGYLFIAESVVTSGEPFTIRVDPNGMVPGNVQQIVWGAIEVSGLAPDSLDQTGLFPATGDGTSTTVATAGVTRQGNELAVAVHSMRSQDVDVMYTHDPEWTEHHVNSDGVTVISAHSMVSLITTEPDTVSHTWTHVDPTRGAAAIIATFRGQ